MAADAGFRPTERNLIVLAHPLQSSYCAALAKVAVQTLSAHHSSVQFIDLYDDRFSPLLTEEERTAYYSGKDYPQAPYARELTQTTHLVLVFPQWWFSLPAAMKGFIDRAFAPGVAFEHANDYGPIRPSLTNLKRLTAICTLGSPAWVDWLYMRRPLERVLRNAVLKACAPKAQFTMLTHYDVERSSIASRQAFMARVERTLEGFARSA